MIRLIVITAVLALVAAVGRWLARRSRSRVFWEDRCAGCGYIVQGLPGHVCPECGADLRRAGAVLPPGVVPGISVNWIFVLWTAAFGVAYVVVDGLWLSDMPDVYIVEASGHYENSKFGYDGFSANYKGEMYRGAPVSGRLEVVLHLRGGSEARMVVDPVTWAYHTTAGPVQVAAQSAFGTDALDQIELKTADRYLRDTIRQHNLYVLSTVTADEMDILHLADYVMGVSPSDLVGPASAPPADGATERDRAWFFKLFSLRGNPDGVERMMFFTFLQKAEDTFEF